MTRSAEVRITLLHASRWPRTNCLLAGSGAATDLPLKKSKKSKSTDTTVEPTASTAEVKTLSLDNAVSSKKSRKRAADFMDGEEGTNKTTPVPAADATDEPVPKKSKKSKKDKKDKKNKHDHLLTADGVNGVVEHPGDEDVETATAQEAVDTSMQAEAERTVDQELEDDFRAVASEEEAGYVDEVPAADNAAALLAGFDSDSEDNQEDTGLNLTTTPALPKSKKVRKKLDKLKAQSNDGGPGTVYVGRVPHGFYEKQMREYFSQFGDITRLRMSRNKRTGASKHFAFIEFSSNEVAKIVAETMDNYLLFGHILKCKYAPPESLHPDVWKGANKKYRKIPHEKLERERLAAPKSADKWQKKVEKEQRKREEKAKKLQTLGLDMPASTLTDPSEVVKEKLITTGEPKLLEHQEPGSTASIEAADGGEKKSKKDKKSKKEKKEKKKQAASAEEEKQGKDEQVESVAVTEPAAPAVEAATDVNDDKSTKEPQLSKKERQALKKVATVPESELSKEEKKALKNAQRKIAKAQEKTATVEKTVAEPAEPSKAAEQPVGAQTEVTEAQVVKGDDTVAQDPQLTKKDKKAAKKAKKEKKTEEHVQEASEPAEAEEKTTEAAAAADASESTQAEAPALGNDADFVSFGDYNDEKESASDSDSGSDAGKATRSTLSNASRGPKGKKYKKEKKPKKERKNLVKARGPKSKLVAIKPKPDTTAATGKLPGVPLLGKAKYDKAARQAHKELKNKILKNKIKGPRAGAGAQAGKGSGA